MKALYCTLISCLGAISVASASLFLTGATFKAIDGTSAFPDGGLMQLINLGADGVGNPVQEGDWVSGDDILIDLAFGSSEFATSGGFDLFEGDSGNAGELQRLFSLSETVGVVEQGDLIALRWWPSYTADDFHDSPFTPLVGDAYGEITVQSSISTGNTAWIFPPDTELLALFEPVISPDAVSGPLSATSGFDGVASKKVTPIPEPAAASLILAFGLLASAHRFRIA